MGGLSRLLSVSAGALILTFGPLAAHQAAADEGLWAFDHVPAAAIKARYGVNVDQAWLDHVQASAVRLDDGCSAGVVSAQGLVLTSDHCVSACAQALSTRGQDFAKLGFFTAARSDERQCPGLQAEILVSMTDVTAPIRQASANRKGRDFVSARAEEIAVLESQACAGKESLLRCQVASSDQAGEYQLSVFRKYDDVRLVFAPEFQAAFFGGDPDNFNFPRFDFDVAFLRLYQGGKPAATPDHLRWNPAAPREGEPVFVAGNPGSTSRLLTADQLESLRDFVLPEQLLRLSEERGLLTRFSAESPERARVARQDLFVIENEFKSAHGEEQTLADPAFIEAKRHADATLRARVAVDPVLAAQIGDPWAEISTAQIDHAALRPSYTLLERAGTDSELYFFARTLVRAAAERAKPNGERLTQYTDARLPLLWKRLSDAEPLDADLEQLKLEFWLTGLRETLTADALETQAFLGRSSPQALSRVLATSQLGDPAVRRRLWNGGMPAVQASDDPMIRYVLATDAVSRAARRTYEEAVLGPVDRAEQRIARARFAVYGEAAYPDASFTLRLSYGAVAGWTYRGQVTPAFTDLAGLYLRATAEDPYVLPPRWQAAKGRLNLQTTFDLATTNDIVGGNSGSPLIDAKGEVIGAVFDGNIHSLAGAYAYDPDLNRAIAVSAAAVTEALDKVYGQAALVRELIEP